MIAPFMIELSSYNLPHGIYVCTHSVPVVLGQAIADGSIFQALEKWGNWGQIAPGVSNGQSEIKFTKLEFARPEPVAAQFDPDEGFTGVNL